MNTVNPLYNDTLYNSKTLYNVISISTKVPVKLKIEFTTTENQFNIKLLGAKHCRCKEGCIFLSINFIICFGCSKEPSHSDCFFEYPQHMVWLSNMKTNLSCGMGFPTVCDVRPAKPQISLRICAV